MNYLKNGCRYGDLTIHPKNYNTTRASLKKEWKIWYRFYDDRYKKKYPKGKLVVIKDGFKGLDELDLRRELIQIYIELEKNLLEKGYNPIIHTRKDALKTSSTSIKGLQDNARLVYNELEQKWVLVDSLNSTISSISSITETIDLRPLKVSDTIISSSPETLACPKQIIPIDDGSLTTCEYLNVIKDFIPEKDTSFITALWLAVSRVECVPATINDIGAIIRGTEKAAKILQFTDLKISEVSKRHIRLIFDTCQKINPNFSNNRFNRYRGTLRRLFKPLVNLDVIESNPIAIGEFERKKIIKPFHDILTNEQRRIVHDYLYKTDYNFLRFVHIFFHSGARITELASISDTNVDLNKQQYKLLIKKGETYRWVTKTIKDVALVYWREIMEEVEAFKKQNEANGKEIFLFSRLLSPGYKGMGAETITARWLKYVKKDLGIDVRFYRLKHLHTTEVMDILDDTQGVKEAEKLIAGHNSQLQVKMVQDIYDVKNEERKERKIKNISNVFA